MIFSRFSLFGEDGLDYATIYAVEKLPSPLAGTRGEAPSTEKARMQVGGLAGATVVPHQLPGPPRPSVPLKRQESLCAAAWLEASTPGLSATKSSGFQGAITQLTGMTSKQTINHCWSSPLLGMYKCESI